MVAIVPAIGAIGALAGGAGSFLGALGGGGGSATGAPTGADYISLYAAQLAPGNTRLTLASQQLAALQGPYVQGLNTSTALKAASALGQFNQSAYKDQKLTDLQSGIAGGLANAYINNLDLAAKYKTATEFLGPTAAADMALKYADTASALQNTVLTGEASALNKVTEGQVMAGLDTAQKRNELASNIANTNLDIRKRQEDTKNALALQRGQVAGKLALIRAGAELTLAGSRAFA